MSQETKPISGKAFDYTLMKRLLHYVKPYKSKFILSVLATILLAGLTPLRPYLIQYTIDNHILKFDYNGLLITCSVITFLLFFHATIQYYQTYQLGWVGQNIVRDIRVKLFEHLIKLKLRYYDRNPIGTLVTRTTSDIETLSDVFTDGLASVSGDILQLVFIIAIMFWQDWKLSLVSLSVFPLLIYASYLFKTKVKQGFQNVRKQIALLNAFVQEHITGMGVVQIFNREKKEFEKFKKINADHTKANINTIFYYSVFFPAVEIISAVSTGLLVWYGARGVLHETVTIGTLISFILYISMFFRPIRTIADRFNTLQMGMVCSERIFKILDTNEFISDTGKLCPAKVNGHIRFENVSFSYIKNNYVLKNISFDIETGKTLAIVGVTGAGKSSLINILNRFYEFDKGKILIDGIDIRDYKIEYLRKQIGIVLQDVFLFSGTIRDNITLGNNLITEQKIIETCDLIEARQFIGNLPGGLNFNVMERGAVLSSGQRQILSFIRAMVHNPQILILDEATSSVDSNTEDLIQKAISKMLYKRTSIVIAHRLSTIQKADKILVINKGEIVEQGTHTELLLKNGNYKELYQMQYRLQLI